MRTRALLIIVIACFSFIPMIAFSAYTGKQITDKAETQYNEMLTAFTEKQVHNVEYLFDYYIRVLSYIAGDQAVVNFSNGYEQYLKMENSEKSEIYNETINAMNAYISTELTSGMSVYGVSVFDNEGLSVIGTNDIFDKILSSPWYENSKDMTIYTFIEPELFGETEYKLIGKKRINNNYSVAVIFDNTNLKNIFENSVISTYGRIILIDPNKNVLDNSYVGNLEEITKQEYRIYKDYIITNGFNTGFEQLDNRMGLNKRISFLSSVEDSDWFLGTIGESDNAFVYSEEVNRDLMNCIIYFGVFTFIIGVLTIIIITKPIQYITKTLGFIKRGNRETRFSIKSDNEFNYISNGFNNLLDNLAASEIRYKNIIEMSENIIFEWNLKTNQVNFSDSFNKKFSHPTQTSSFEDSFLSKCDVHPKDAELYKSNIENLSKGATPKKTEYRLKNIFGDYVYVLMNTDFIRNDSGEIIKIVGTLIVIDEDKNSGFIDAADLRYDSVTELYDSKTVKKLIEKELKRENKLAILVIDVDDFKRYNEDYSHTTGNQVLSLTAEIINKNIKGFGFAGRYGGDEFVVGLRNSDVNDPAKVSRKIIDDLKEGLICDAGNKLSVTVSIGIMTIHDSSKSVEEIISKADKAMQEVKENGKSDYGFAKN